MANTEFRASNDHDRDALTAVIDALARLEPAARARLLKTVAIFYAVELPADSSATPDPQPVSARNQPRFDFSSQRELSPKDFLADKLPETDIERVACLAYYLTHFRDSVQFRTIDINRLNTEAAQIKFSNAANAVNNASKRGFLAAAGKGMKQITADGEAYVMALPDRAAAAAAVAKRRSRARGRPRKKA